jgi:predicted lipase
MMLASHYAYPQAFGMTNRDNDTFRKKFEETFRRFGMKAFKFVANSNTAPFPSTRSWAVRAMVFSNDKVVVVSFRGSEMDLIQAPIDTWRNWVGTNLQTRLRPEKILGPGVEVHDGFWTALDSVYKGLAAEVVRQGGFKGKKVFLTGHSLGGALATLCALRLQKDRRGSAAVYTYGSPRVGNDKFQAAFRLPHQRWVNQNDLVTQVPPELAGYRPVGTLDHILANGKVKQNDKEVASPQGEVMKFLEAAVLPPVAAADAAAVVKAVGNHAPPLYSRALYNNLPNALKSKVPDPPTK